MKNKLIRVLIFCVLPLLVEMLVFYLASVGKIDVETAGIIALFVIAFIYATNKKKRR